MDKRKHGWEKTDKESCRICFTFVGWSQNKTGTQKHENYTAVRKNKFWLNSFFPCQKEHKNWSPYVKMMKDAWNRLLKSTEMKRHNMVTQNGEVQTELWSLYNLSWWYLAAMWQGLMGGEGRDRSSLSDLAKQFVAEHYPNCVAG